MVDTIVSSSPSPVSNVGPQVSHPEFQRVIRGMILVVLGILWILSQTGILGSHWFETYGLVILGGLMIMATVASGKYRLFLGSVFLMTGLFHMVLDRMPADSLRTLWPVYFAIMGMGFLTRFAADSRRWLSLMLGTAAMGLGGLALGHNVFRIPFDPAVAVRIYWPLGLMACGAVMVAAALWPRRPRA